MNRPGLGIGVLLQRDVVHIGNGALVPSDQSLAADAAQNRVHAAQLLDLVVDQVRVRGIGEIPLVLRDI